MAVSARLSWSLLSWSLRRWAALAPMLVGGLHCCLQTETHGVHGYD